MKTPRHWQNKNLLANFLAPLGWLYTYATKLNLAFKKPNQVNRPVICIGNLTAGGSGKTPVAVSIAEIIQNLGKKPFFVSRGYGGTLHNLVVDTAVHQAQEVGDEPLLLARQAPVVINPNRYEGAKTAIRNGAEVIIMDDGFQNPGLHKDLAFLVFDGNFGYGNGYGIPAGPMREALESGLKRAQAVIIIGEDKHHLKTQITTLPIFEGQIIPHPPKICNFKVIAFAGIGRPEKFYQSLRSCGFELVETIDFPDHHQYKPAELEAIITKAAQQETEIYTTAKDYVKIPAELQTHFKVLEIAIEWQDREALTTFLQKYL